VDVLNSLNIDESLRIGTTSSSPYLGSPTFDAVPFHVDVGRRPVLGTYAVVATDTEEVALYGQIIEGVEENPRANPGRLQQNLAYQIGQKDPRPGDNSPHVTRVLTVEVLGEIREDGNGAIYITEPGLLGQTGRGVYELPADAIPWLLNIPESPDSGLHIGHIESGGHAVEFNLPLEAIARHLAVVGKTGVGKSYAVGVIVEELVRHGIPIISFDVLGDVVNAAEDLGGQNLRAGDDFHVPYSVIGVSEFLNFIPNLTSPQSELVAVAYDKVFGDAYRALNARGEVVLPLDNLTREIEQVAARFGQEAVGARAISRIEAAVRFSGILTTHTEQWLNDFTQAPITNVFIGHLGQNARNLVVGATARMLQILRRSGLVPPFVFLLDEAHFFLPSGGSSTPSTHVIRELIRTARHDAIGVILVTQSPSSMDRQALMTCNTRLVFSLDKDDLHLMSGTMGDLADQVVARIPKLARGTAIVSSGIDIMRHPAQVHIRKRTSREGAPTPNLAQEVKLWRQQNR